MDLCGSRADFITKVINGMENFAGGNNCCCPEGSLGFLNFKTNSFLHLNTITTNQCKLLTSLTSNYAAIVAHEALETFSLQLRPLCHRWRCTVSCIKVPRFLGTLS